jgi:hypothetical protein
LAAATADLTGTRAAPRLADELAASRGLDLLALYVVVLLHRVSGLVGLLHLPMHPAVDGADLRNSERASTVASMYAPLDLRIEIVAWHLLLGHPTAGPAGKLQHRRAGP